MRRALLAAVLIAIPLLGAARSAATDGQRDIDDPTIVAIFDMANTFDIETGQLAAERGQNLEVRAFGRMLVYDHGGVRQMGRDLAKKLGVTPTPPPEGPFSLKHKAAMKALREVSAAEFDQAFLKHEVAYHAEVIQIVTETLLPAIVNAELRAMVVKVAPAFEAHRAGAEALGKRLAEGRR